MFIPHFFKIFPIIYDHRMAHFICLVLIRKSIPDLMTSVAWETNTRRLEEVPLKKEDWGKGPWLPQQCQLVLVKMHKVQEMSNNFSNDINPFHVYDKRSLALPRWPNADDDDVDVDVD